MPLLWPGAKVWAAEEETQKARRRWFLFWGMERVGLWNKERDGGSLRSQRVYERASAENYKEVLLPAQGTEAQGGHATCSPPHPGSKLVTVSSPKTQTGFLLPYLAASTLSNRTYFMPGPGGKQNRKVEKQLCAAQRLCPFPMPRTTPKARPTQEGRRESFIPQLVRLELSTPVEARSQ